MISSVFDDDGAITGDIHTAVDISAGDSRDGRLGGGPIRGFGTPVRSINAGVVTSFGTENGVNYVKVYYPDQNIEASYGHVTAASGLAIGQTVNRGQQLGVIDSSGNVTGPHLHMVFREGGDGEIPPAPGFPSNGRRFDPEAFLPCERTADATGPRP